MIEMLGWFDDDYVDNDDVNDPPWGERWERSREIKEIWKDPERSREIQRNPERFREIQRDPKKSKEILRVKRQ